MWISSTIPDGWIWQPSSSAGEDNPLFRRQSTSELEADAVAHGCCFIVVSRLMCFISRSLTNINLVAHIDMQIS